MKKIISIILILCVFILASCKKESVDIPTPTVPSEVSDVFQIEVHGLDHIDLIDETMFSEKTKHFLDVKLENGLIDTYIGYRLTDFLQKGGLDLTGFSVKGASTSFFQIELNQIYIIIGKKTFHNEIDFLIDDIMIIRYLNQSIRDVVLRPDTIDFTYTNDQTPIYFIGYNQIPGRYDAHTSLRAIQGIVNRYAPRLLTISSGNPYYRNSDIEWLYILESKGYLLKQLSSLEEVLFQFKDDFKGIITFRDRFKSYNNWVSAESDFALMMASLKDYAPIPFGMHHVMESLTGLDLIPSFEINGVTVLGNLSEYLDQENITDAFGVYEHVFHTFKEAFNQSAYMSLTSEVMDYAASQKMMFFDLKATQNPRDHQLSREINAYFRDQNDYFSVYGWVDHESSALDFISSYGGVIDVVGSGNLSLLGQLPIDKIGPFVQKAKDRSTYDKDKKYVTFFASESDTIKVGAAFQHGAWFDPNRGKVPINWGLPADISYEFPFVYDYFYDTATENDYFYSGGGSAIGFVDIDSQMPLSARNAIADANQYYMTYGDQHIIDMYNDKYTPTDLFEKNVLGAYMSRSNIMGAFARIHDGNTSIRVEQWSSVPVYNRWTNFYPRRAASGHVQLTQMQKISDQRYEQKLDSDYWFIEATLANTSLKTGFDLFIDEHGQGYRIYFLDGMLYVCKIVGSDEIVISEMIFNKTNKKVKMIVDKSSPLDTYTRFMLYVNDLIVLDFIDETNYKTSGGFALFSDFGVKEAFTALNGTRFSQAQFIYQRIVSDINRFIVAYYGFVGSTNHTLSMYRSEPGISGVISLSPTDFYKIYLLLEQHHPNTYEIVNAKEFLTYAITYQSYFGNLR